MADANLSTSISAIRTKILNDTPTATVDELVSLSRAAKSIGLTEDTSIETAINSRANTLSSNATTNDMVKLSNAIKQLRNTTAGAVSPSTTSDDIVEGTSNLYYTDARTDARIALNGASVDISDVAPTSPSDGDLWFKSDTLDLYIYYDDGVTSQWVQAAGSTSNSGGSSSSSSTIPFTKFYLSASQPGSTVSSSSYLGQNVGTWYEVTFANAANTAGLSPDSSDRDPTLTGITFSGDKFSGFVQNGTYEISVQPEVYERNTTAGQRYHGWESSTGAFSSAGWLSPGTGSFNINGLVVPDSIIVTFEDATPANNWVRYILESDQSGDYWIGQAILTIKKIG